jgi:predicted TIM-barrel fold metal-dependent hydrolase
VQIFDAHHHLWDLNLHHYPWLADRERAAAGGYEAICNSYLLADFLADADPLDVVGSVHIQAEIDRPLTIRETEWLQGIADCEGMGLPSAIVGYVDLSAPDAESQIEKHLSYPNFRGIRQILNRHSDPKLNSAAIDYLSHEGWLANFALLAKHELTFDLQIYYQQIPDAIALARRQHRRQGLWNRDGRCRLDRRRPAGDLQRGRWGFRRRAHDAGQQLPR